MISALFFSWMLRSASALEKKHSTTEPNLTEPKIKVASTKISEIQNRDVKFPAFISLCCLRETEKQVDIVSWILCPPWLTSVIFLTLTLVVASWKNRAIIYKYLAFYGLKYWEFKGIRYSTLGTFYVHATTDFIYWRFSCDRLMYLACNWTFFVQYVLFFIHW